MDYAEWLGGRACAPSTIERKVTAVKSFCGFLFNSGEMRRSMTAGA